MQDSEQYARTATGHQAPPGMARRLVIAAWHLAQAGMALYGLGMAGFLVLREAVGERSNSVAYGNNFIPWFALVALALLVIGLPSRRRWWLAACQGPILVAFVVLYGDLFLPRSSSAADSGSGPALTIASYNILSSESDPQRVVGVIAALDVDIVGIQEHGPAHRDVFEAQLTGVFPYQVHNPRPGVHGVGLLSRYPVIEHETFTPLPDSMLHLRAVIDVDGVPVVVYVVHPRPPYNWILPPAYDDDLRNAEIAALREERLAHESDPVLVVGDFNMSDQSDAYRGMDTLLDDTFREVGRGLGLSWPRNLWFLPAILRIDYIWCSEQFAVQDAYTVEDAGTSDHRPVVAVLGLEGG